MGRTPDRQPGEALEEKLVLQDDGLTADNPGEVVFVGGAFSMRDNAGLFDPRTGGVGAVIDQLVTTALTVGANKTLLLDDPDLALTGSVELPIDGNVVIL